MLPAQIVIELNQKFSTEFTMVQVRRLISGRGWGKRLRDLKVKELEKASAPIISAEVEKPDTLATQHDLATMDVFANKAEIAALKAFAMVELATDARTLASAAAAARSMVSTYRTVRGMDAAAGKRTGPATFNFNFAAQKLPPRKVDQVAELAVTLAGSMAAAPADGDED